MRFGTVSRAAGLLFGLSLLALASSCGGGGGGDSTGRASGVEGVPDGAAFINQDGLKFSPSGLSVAAGETVYFKNSETAVHSVTIDGKNESGTMKHDMVFQWTPPGAGTYKITCDFHPQMKATITVQ
jgi:plastocyanin